LFPMALWQHDMCMKYMYAPRNYDNIGEEKKNN